MSNPRKTEIHRDHWAVLVGAFRLIEALGLPLLAPGHVDVEPPGIYGANPDYSMSGEDIEYFTVRFTGTDLNAPKLRCMVTIENGFPKMAWLQYDPNPRTPSLVLEYAPMPFAHFQEDGSIKFDDVEEFRNFFGL